MARSFGGMGRETTVVWFTVSRSDRSHPELALDCEALQRPTISIGFSMSGLVRLLVIMDPIERIKPAKDSTLAMLIAAQQRAKKK